MARLAFGVLAIVILFPTVRISAAGGQTVQNSNPVICGNLSSLHQLWEDCAFGMDPNRTERSAWIIRNSEGKFEFRRWPRSSERNKELWSGPVPVNVVAQVHTHPVIADGKPSQGDTAVAGKINVPVFVISSNGIWSVSAEGKMLHEEGPGWYQRLSGTCK